MSGSRSASRWATTMTLIICALLGGGCEFDLQSVVMNNPPYVLSERQRSQLGHVELSVRAEHPIHIQQPWMKSNAAIQGAKTGAVMGTALALADLRGIVLVPVTAPVGAMVGLGVPKKVRADAEGNAEAQRIRAAAATLDPVTALEVGVVRTSEVEAGRRLAVASSKSGSVLGQHADTRLELTLTKWGLCGSEFESEPDFAPVLEVRGRVVRLDDGKTLLEKTWKVEGTGRKFTAWADGGEPLLREEYARLYERLQMTIVTELFTLVYA
jgi:hypothetical protein